MKSNKFLDTLLLFKMIFKNKKNVLVSFGGLLIFILVSLCFNIYSSINLKVDYSGYVDNSSINNKYLLFTIILSVVIGVIFLYLTSKLLIGDIKNNMHKIETHYGYSKLNIFFSRLGYLYLLLGVFIGLNALMGSIFYFCSNEIVRTSAYQMFLADNSWLLLVGCTSILLTIVFGFLLSLNKGNILVSILLCIFLALPTFVTMIFTSDTQDGKLIKELTFLAEDRKLYEQLRQDDIGSKIFDDIDEDLAVIAKNQNLNIIDTTYQNWNSMFATLLNDNELNYYWQNIYNSFYKNLIMPKWYVPDISDFDQKKLIGLQYFNFFCYHSLDTDSQFLIEIADHVLELSSDTNWTSDDKYSFFNAEFLGQNWGHNNLENPDTIEGIFKWSIEHIYSSMIVSELMFGNNNYYYQIGSNEPYFYYLLDLENMVNTTDLNLGIHKVENWNKKQKKQFIVNPINQLSVIFYGNNFKDPEQSILNYHTQSTTSVDNICLTTNPIDNEPNMVYDLNVKFQNIETVQLINSNALIASYILISLISSNATFFWFIKKF